MAVDAKQAVLLDTLRKLLRRGASGHLVNMLQKLRPADIAPLLSSLADPERTAVIVQMGEKAPGIAASIVSELHPVPAAELLQAMPPETIGQILAELPYDEAADFMAALPHELQDQVLGTMTREDAAAVQRLLLYPPDTAGRIMTPDAFSLVEDLTIEEAIRSLQQQRDLEMAFYLYVVDDRSHLVGVLSLRQLLVNDPARKLKDVMTTDVIKVRTDMDQEEVARIVSKYDIIAVPVVDDQSRLVGVITIDDVIDVVREEATEDFYKMAGTSDEEKVQRSVLKSARSRLPWLFWSFFGGLLVAFVVGAYQDVLSGIVVLAGFFPVILGMGGNIGTQSSTIMVRGLATGRIEMRQVWTAIFKEVRIALLLGLVYGTLLSIAAWALVASPFGSKSLGHAEAGFIIGLSLFLSMFVAAAIGTLLPVILKKVGLDPARAAGPFVTTTVDVLGTVIYLSMASMMLRR
jgi:magnesium transporter